LAAALANSSVRGNATVCSGVGCSFTWTVNFTPALSVIAFTPAASFPSSLLAPLGKFAAGQRKCYLHFREGKILSCAPGQNQSGGWL